MLEHAIGLFREDIEQAFQEAEQGLPVVLSFNHHDFRDMRPDVIRVQEMLKAVVTKYPAIKFRYSEARDAMRSALELPKQKPIDFEVQFEKGRLSLKASSATFGPQPFFAIQTKDNQFFHDNLDFQVPFHEWSYVFDELTYPVEALAKVGVGACDATGNVTVVNIDICNNEILQLHY